MLHLFISPPVRSPSSVLTQQLSRWNYGLTPKRVRAKVKANGNQRIKNMVEETTVVYTTSDGREEGLIPVR